MRKIGLLVIPVVVVFFSCKKSTGIHLVPGPTDPTEILGNWQLQASRIGFAVGNTDTTWKPSAEPAAIVFASSGNFSSDAGYAYKDEGYDRYAADTLSGGAGQFLLVATVPPTGDFPRYHARVQLINKDQLVISYMGVDYTPQELYTRK
jgi:hypothetical protein